MKVALVVRALSVHGGTERVALGLARHLVAAGDAVTAWVLDDSEAVEGVTLRRLPRARGRLPRMLALRQGVALARQRDPEVVLSLARSPGADVWRAGGGCHARYLHAEQRSRRPVERIEERFDRRAAQTAGLVVINSEMVGRDLVDRYGVAPESLRLVRNGVDLDRFRPTTDRSPPIPRPAVVLVGHGWRRKGLSAALGVLTALPAVHLAVIGRERWPGRWLREARRLGVAPRLHLLGPMNRLERVLPSFDAMLLPTRYDPSANACLEALACGVPVVTTADNGASEVLPDPTWGGFLPNDVTEMAEALERVLQDPRARDAARAAAERWPQAAAAARLRALLVESTR